MKSGPGQRSLGHREKLSSSLPCWYCRTACYNIIPLNAGAQLGKTLLSQALVSRTSFQVHNRDNLDAVAKGQVKTKNVIAMPDRYVSEKANYEDVRY